ncbi:MAG: hypothetical protein J6A63_08325 [Clostridia bacterium]|nr:hypothetical protein [Clostridia bacterium]
MLDLQAEVKKLLLQVIQFPTPEDQELAELSIDMESVVKKISDLPLDLRRKAYIVFAKLLHKYGLI